MIKPSCPNPVLLNEMIDLGLYLKTSSTMHISMSLLSKAENDNLVVYLVL